MTLLALIGLCLMGAAIWDVAGCVYINDLLIFINLHITWTYYIL